MKVLVTGGSTGMGKGVAKILAGSDDQTHEIIILCRSKERGEAAIEELIEITKNEKISLVLCDLAKLSDVRNAIKEIHSEHEFLDGIYVNAGVGYAAERVVTEDGMDQHFQVNYLSQFMLTLNLMELLENSKNGGRVIFNVNEGGEIDWDDLQMEKEWGYEKGIQQAMLAKRMFAVRLHNLYRNIDDSEVSSFNFKIPKTVWTNQINIIPFFMKTMATVMKIFGGFISIEESGMIISPLFTENQEESLKKSGKLITWKDNRFTEITDDKAVYEVELQEKLWKISVDFCNDEKTAQIAEKYSGISI
jgi:hypothetical protein